MGENFLSKSSSRYQSRSFGISLSYRIGELKASVKKAARSINNDDVKGAADKAVKVVALIRNLRPTVNSSP